MPLPPARRFLRMLFRRLLYASGGLLLLLGLAYAGMVAFLSWREQGVPSTSTLIKLPDGRTVALVQPTIPSPGSATAAEQTGVVPPPPPDLLPPERIRIDRLGLNWPVVLGDNENVPEFKAVGWYFGSAFPGFPGNMVLFGHVDGPHPTFARLGELQPGDEFVVTTMNHNHLYRVRMIYETTSDDVSVLLPSDGPTATLITCSGPWNPLYQTNERRLIVLADYVGR